MDDYGNKITLEKVKQNLIQILDQYGILQKDLVTKLFDFIREDEQSKKIQDKLLNWLLINSPSIGQILSLDVKD